MGWATQYIEQLKRGATVQFRPRGHSMKGRIESGQLVTVVPIQDHAVLKVGDIVLCRVHGREFLHLVKAVAAGAKTFTIGNNRGHVNGTVGRNCVFGICTQIE